MVEEEFGGSNEDLVTKPSLQPKRKRPTTAPRQRPALIDEVMAQSSAGHRSAKKIKTYLHHEFSQNRFLSVQDYKVMTQQVVQLRNIEQQYLSESLTA